MSGPVQPPLSALPGPINVYNRPGPVQMRPDSDWSLLGYADSSQQGLIDTYQTNPLPGNIAEIWDYAQCFGHVVSRLRDYCGQMEKWSNPSQYGSAVTTLQGKQAAAKGNLTALATRFEKIELALHTYWPWLMEYQTQANALLNQAYAEHEQYLPVLNATRPAGPPPTTPAVSLDPSQYYRDIDYIRWEVDNLASSRDAAAQKCADAIDAAGTDSLKDNDWEFHRALEYIDDLASWVNMVAGSAAILALIIPPPVGEAIAGALESVALGADIVELVADCWLINYGEDRWANLVWDFLGLIPMDKFVISYLPFRESIPILKDERFIKLGWQGTQDVNSELGSDNGWSPWLPPNPFNAPIPRLQGASS